MNVVMAEGGGLIEIQGTAEQRPFQREQLDRMLDLARRGHRQDQRTAAQGAVEA